MSVNYKISIANPAHHQLQVRVDLECPSDTFICSLPVWSPGSYMVREYSRNLSKLKLTGSKGEFLELVQTKKNLWQAGLSALKDKKITLSYDVYCHETTVRTSYIDHSHAFLHGPSVFMNIEGLENTEHILQVDLPAEWTKISTGLKDVSSTRETFLYSSDCYDNFIDCPIELGNQETDGFMFSGLEHELAFYGTCFKHKHNLKKDIEIIVEHVSSYFDDIPYDRYVFITHFLPGIFGGLEHKNSTALQFDSSVLQNRKDYVNWLALVAHEYFHTWNVKRIRPSELGPFDYNQENYTSMLWLAEGLTSYMDDIMIYRANLCSLEEYLDIIKEKINQYHSIAGRHFDSLEASSFNAWIKLYRPDENSKNSTVSYYLKGGLVFLSLQLLMVKEGKSVDQLTTKLWESYKARTELGLKSDEVYEMIKEIAGDKISLEFQRMIQTTEDIDFKNLFNQCGMDFVYEDTKNLKFGVTFNPSSKDVVVTSVELDSGAYKSGLNAGDEILAVDGIRINSDRFKNLEKNLVENQSYTFLISRRQMVFKLEVQCEVEDKKISKIEVKDLELTKRALAKFA
ncbi:PDZ domain-containing protein [bacterium]|nr:PDZ domain-containing protein [bacterium]